MRREWIEMKTLELNDVLLQGLPPCGGSGLKSNDFYNRHCVLLSPSMRREWIEIISSKTTLVHGSSLPPCGGSGLKYKSGNLEITGTGSPSMRREWIEIYPVLLEMEGLFKSPSMRREWIEMSADIQPLRTVLVSLHAEGVD